ncbi:NRAMP (natural resistance-associated macrophage protein) metal ion transporters [Dethiosulfatibacter aminovorans DSM 17477]|uniref:NRAMP (Natural resistance-associated macrophage protein) metal ion transporters n=1 Tax=Dethiosulfatibacter aminovorans DSM 17477 TaxID=1121476 RepID=A0A1M6M053_9FIRM|nr:Nramp family divalent metal transporter [Dethiosulfatibacter aminovorans]SHJ76867.1 NRAMP (natural resistance-associated macrophage protein) metal ion transporters [Dethiosulfatibacter aminovorans DSM 17477]
MNKDNNSNKELSVTEPNKNYTLLDYVRNLGPGAVVCATIIGPGTITTCTLAGVQFQYSLGWAVIFSIVTAIILQMFSSKVGIVSGKGLAEVIYETYKGTKLQYIFAALVIMAIGVGNSAFQSGNMIGAVLGVNAIFYLEPWKWGLILALIVFTLLWSGKYVVIEKVMTAMVFLMVITFILTAIAVKPDLGLILKGFIPGIPDGGMLVTMSLIGTTVIPHLLFMHSSMSSSKWSSRNKNNAIKESNFDTSFNMVMGGIITICVIITGAAMFGVGVTISSGLDMAKQLEPLVGSWARYIFGIGLFSAGITSSLAAPMSAGYAICGIMNWSTDLKSKKFRIIWIIVLLAGFIATASGYKPVQVILVAQTFNGIILPISVIMLMMAVNNKKILGDYTNKTSMNIIGIMVTLITIMLGAKTLYVVLPKLF